MTMSDTKPSGGGTPTMNQTNTNRGKLMRMGKPSGLAPKGGPTTRP